MLRKDFWSMCCRERLGIPSMFVTGSHGLRKQDMGGDHLAGASVPATCFLQPPA